MVALVVIIALISLIVPSLQQASQKSKRIHCINNLIQIGIACRIWTNDHEGQFPAFTARTNGGWREFVYLTNAGTYCWTNYLTMANELGQSSYILACPSDERKPADTFHNLVANTNISYFVGVDANEMYPESILGGDRNLGPGATPDPEYGFSPTNGKGNDVIVDGPVCWSLKMHSPGNPGGAGNILLGDGSVQQVTSSNLNENWVKNALLENGGHDKATNLAGIRLIFP